MRLKRLFRKINRRTIVTLSLIGVIFVMSLGYAALSQYIEIDGVALIDRNWIINITDVTSSVTGTAINKSSPYVGSTVTMHATIPDTSSTVTYTITLKNEGNLRAKLHSIEKIEDDNTSISYAISGVEEGKTELNPGETNTVTLTIKAKDGVSNLSNTEKSVMLSFYYVENTVDHITGGNTSGETYPEYSVGDYVMLVDGTRGTITKDSGTKEEYVSVFLEDQYGDYAFDTTGSTKYDPTSTTNIGYQLENTILPTIKTSISNAGGNTAGMSIRLLTLGEYNSGVDRDFSLQFTVANYYGTYTWGPATWLMDAYDSTNVQAFTPYLLGNTSATSNYPVRPVITLKKSNIAELATKILIGNTLKADSFIDFSAISSSRNGQGVYWTAKNTNDDSYYFRGNVTNNYVSFADKTWRIIRINKDGTVRMVLSDTLASWLQAYGTSINYNASSLQTYINNWYDSNLTSFSAYLADSGFCNDTSVSSTSDTQTFYGAHGRLVTNKQPQYKCPNESSDLFTLSGSGKGNELLTKAIGTLTADELVYAGALFNTENSTYYLNNGTWYFTMSPYHNSAVFRVKADGIVDTHSLTAFIGVRPVINLKSTVTVSTGNGTSGTPYVIKTS